LPNNKYNNQNNSKKNRLNSLLSLREIGLQMMAPDLLRQTTIDWQTSATLRESVRAELMCHVGAPNARVLRVHLSVAMRRAEAIRDGRVTMDDDALVHEPLDRYDVDDAKHENDEDCDDGGRRCLDCGVVARRPTQAEGEIRFLPRQFEVCYTNYVTSLKLVITTNPPNSIHRTKQMFWLVEQRMASYW
jgi:hypothetical protein